jgi:hypothetical protein
MCGPTDIGCHVGEGITDVVDTTIGKLAESIGDSAMAALNAVATFWMKNPTPAVATGADTSTPQNTEIVQYLQDNVLEISAAVFTVAILIAAVRTAWEQRAEPLKSLLQAIFTYLVVSAAGTATMQLLISWSDGLAESIIEQVHPDRSTLGTALGAMVLQGLSGNNGMTMMLMFTGVVVVLASLVQIVLMVIRTALLILLAGTFPLAAAATNTEIGRTWFRKYCGWSLAFIAYKPAAALIYATALKMNEQGVHTSTDAFVRTTTGLMMLLMAIFALPALMRFVVPVTAAVAGGSAGMGAAAADPGGAATGAVSVGRPTRAGSGAGSPKAGGGPAGAALVGAGIAVNGTRKAAGGVAGAAAHSAGESAGGSATPTTPVRSKMSKPDPPGPSGGW